MGARGRRVVGVAIACVVGTSLAAAAGATGDADRLERGRALYTESCMRCHGPGGAGDGPDAAETRIPTADLTRIAERRGGVFPDAQVSEIIDGRRYVRAHGPSGMPVWGKEFGPSVSGGPDGVEVRDRIRLLVEYLRSIQRSPPSQPD